MDLDSVAGVLIGGPSPEISMLEMVPNAESEVDRNVAEILRQSGPPSPREVHVRGIFEAAQWVFRPDGTLLFRPPAGAKVRDDLFPMPGSYTIEERFVRIRAEQQSALGASASIDGVVHKVNGQAQLDLIFTVGSMAQQSAVRITQTLSRAHR